MDPDLAPPLRTFLRTESGSAGVLVAAIVAALIWSNVNASSYESVWNTDFSIQLGSIGVSRDLRTWINSGLMTFFFLVVGLEARREIDLGELRDRRRFVLPLAAGGLGMLLPVAIYLAVTAGRSGGHGWGVAMSTDTALAMGLLALIGSGVPAQMRAFLVTVFVVDDLVAVVVIAAAYGDEIRLVPFALAVAAFAVFVLGLTIRVDLPPLYVLLGLAVWSALLASGVDPIVTGLATGLVAWAYSPTRGDLEQATGFFRLFREQPTPELARVAATSLTSTLSPNARLQRFYHTWTSYGIVPLFGLANAGIEVKGDFLVHAYTAPVTLGIQLGLVVGKPVAVVGASVLISRSTGGRIKPPIGWAAVGYCGQAEAEVQELLRGADVRFVWRHLPLVDVHPHAQLAAEAAEAAEAANAQGAFWPMHDLLLARQDNLQPADLLRFAEELELDPAQFSDDVRRHVYVARIAQDVESADLSGVSGTPTFFINGQRHYGAYDVKTLATAINTAHARAAISPGDQAF